MFSKIIPFSWWDSVLQITIKINRVGGRLANASLPYETKIPLLLPKKKHCFTKLFVEYLHRKHLHSVPKALQKSSEKSSVTAIIAFGTAWNYYK